MAIRCGIDASSSCTGICFFDEKKLIYYAKIRPYKKIDFRNNVCQIIEQIIPLIEKYKPSIIYMEDIPEYVGKNGIKPLIYLGCVQGIFYNEISYKLNYNIEYRDVWLWRQTLDILKGERTRDKQKSKAVNWANNMFDLQLKYTEGKDLVSNDDDVAEAIGICWSGLIMPNLPKPKKERQFGRKPRIT